MKRNVKILLIVCLALVVLGSVLVAAACEKDITSVTLTVDYGLDGVGNDTLTVDVGKPFFDKLTPPSSSFTFGGWFMGEDEVTNSTLAPKNDFTVKARWLATYRVQYYLERLNDDGFDVSAELTVDGFAELNSTVSAEVKTVNGFTFDENNVGNVKSATLNANGITLKLYYKRNVVTVSFDKLINGASGTMTAVTGKYGSTVTLPNNAFTSSFTFMGWNTASDGSGQKVANGASFTLNANATLYAQWQTSYTVIIYVEKDVTDPTKTESEAYVQHSTKTAEGIIGNKASATADNPNSAKYELDVGSDGASGFVTEQGFELKAYFNLRTFAVRYMDDNTVAYVKYGANHTVRTPANDDENLVVHSYSNSPTGNGLEYNFGDVIKNIRTDITLYPVSSNIYYDYDGSGDYVEIRNNKAGLGSAVLVKGGERHEGWATVTEAGYLEFEVTVGASTYFGRTYVDGSKNLFRYRGEEYGTYLYYDYIFNEFDASRMLLLDGYGTGVLAMFANDGTERWINYYVGYQYNETHKDFDVLYGVPNSSELYETAFRVEKYAFEGEEYADIAGYFTECNSDDESYVYTLYENGELYLVFLTLDGYGNAKVQGTDNSGNVNWTATGKYRGSQNYLNNYNDKSYREYVFISDDEDIYESCYFTYTAIYYGTSTIYVFIPKSAEYGIYTAEGATFPELYLDGYGGALYSIDSDDEGRVGSYTIKIKDSSEGVYTVIIRFLDEAGGSMVADIRIERIDSGMSYGVFTPYEGGFVVDANGVLTNYVYDEEIGPSSVIVIPESVNGVTVKEIAANVFNGINITSVTFPATLEKIGDYAFSNGGLSDASPLRTATFLGANPPILGKDVFRWIKGSNFRIVVPDGAAEAYRTAESWVKEEASQKDGYAKFVTTAAELADKPLYEVRDGVLVSYNNKDDNPTNVAIEIPAEVDGVAVTEIAAGVFTNLTYITSVKLNNVVKIGANAFYGCTGITLIEFNPNTESIGEWAFYNCYNLAEVNLGEVEQIGAYAFARCLKLTKVIIGGSINQIGDSAFYECGRSEDYGYDTDGSLVEIVEMFDLVVEIAATMAPAMGTYVFQGSQPHIYVVSYEVARSYAVADTWSTYVKHVRVHVVGEEQVWYAKSNVDGWVLVLGDRIIFDDNYVGWYKWVDATTLRITWIVYSEIANKVTLEEQIATVVNGELVGIDMSWDEGKAYTFVPSGTTLTYHSDKGETLEITFGEGTGKYNGKNVQFTMRGYRMQFEYDGYIYTVTLYDSSNKLTFTAVGVKITVQTEYVAEDGSTITIFDGSYVRANGRLKNVNGVEIYTETQGWYLTKQSDNVYSFKWNHVTGNYYVVITLLSDSTFSYEWSINSVVTVYHNAETGHLAVVTVPNNPQEEISIHIIFRTANGTEEQTAEILYGSDDVYTIKIDGMADVEDLEGNSYQVPSIFNGIYTLTLHPDATNPTFELVLLD